MEWGQPEGTGKVVGQPESMDSSQVGQPIGGRVCKGRGQRWGEAAKVAQSTS